MSSIIKTDGVWQWLRSHTNLTDITRAYYEETFGAVSQEHIYGDNVMHGMRSLLDQYASVRGGWRFANSAGHSAPKVGWFVLPNESYRDGAFSKANAAQSVSDDRRKQLMRLARNEEGAAKPEPLRMAPSTPYPAAYVEGPDGVYVACVNIIVRRSPPWKIHHTRALPDLWYLPDVNAHLEIEESDESDESDEIDESDESDVIDESDESDEIDESEDASPLRWNELD